MKTSIKAIAATVTAALSLGIMTIVLSNSDVEPNNPPIAEEDNRIASGKIEKLSVKEAQQVDSEGAYTSFEKKVLSCFGTHEDAENNKDENGYVHIDLHPLTVEDCAFGINGSRFFLTVPESLVTSFNEPESFELVIGTEGKMTAKSGYNNNSMRVKIVIAFNENGNTITKMLNYSGTGEIDSPLILNEDDYPVEITYFYYMEDGTGNIIESAVVDLVKI